MKSNIVLLMFTLLLSIAIVAVQNRSHSKRSHKNDDDDQPINWCPNPGELPAKNKLKNKNLQNPLGKFAGNNERFRKIAKKVIMINEIAKLAAGIPKQLIQRDLKDSINIYLSTNAKNVDNEFQKMLNNDNHDDDDDEENFPQSYDWVKKYPKCFGNLSEQSQGYCGSCFIFATVNYFSILRCMNNESGILTPLSTQDVVSCMKTNNGSNNCEGGSPKDVWDHLYLNGVVSHSCKCYKNHDYEKKKAYTGIFADIVEQYDVDPIKVKPNKVNSIERCENKCNDSSIIPIHFKAEVQEMLMTTGSGKTISTLLFNYGILIGNLFYDDYYERYYKESDKDKELTKLNSGKKLSEVMELLYPESNQQKNRHAVIIVGYKFKLDDRCKEELSKHSEYTSVNCVYFKILNSWGKTFGNNGYAYIPDTLISSSYLGFAYKDQLNRFIKERLLNKDIYLYKLNDKVHKLEDLVKHHLS